MRKRLLIIGLDGAEPGLVFGSLRERMPTLSRLAGRGSWGPLRSTVPPITIPAWVSMFTGLDPGELGLYGFRNRADHGYGNLAIASSRSVSSPRVWDRLSDQGLTSYLLGVPGTFPPWPIRGRMVAGPLTASTSSAFTHPPELKREIDRIAGGYLPDVEDYRTEDKARLVEAIRSMTEKRFRVARAWAAEPDWELMVMVEMGPDRMHHAFWTDPDALASYHAFLDGEIAGLLDAAGQGVGVMVVSDHGARSLEGGFRINEWLLQQGDLVLNTIPPGPARLEPWMVDWPRTRAWGEGGYHGRVFLNIEGREPQGCLPRTELETYRTDLADRLGRALDGTRVLYPEEEYRAVRGIPPDLMVYFAGLAFRSIGEVGTGQVRSGTSAAGLDGANHSEDGIFIFAARDSGPAENVEKRSILDLAPMILGYFGLV